jgi:two-component system, OmpR family, phosphate regulon sensor histidine kinase PhoR
VDELVLAFVAGLAILTGGALLLAALRGGSLERLREILGAAEGTDLEAAARRALDERATAEWEAGRAAADTAYLLDLVGAGIIRLDSELRVAAANQAAHVFLDRAQGELVGLSAIEALGDHRIESLARRAHEIGWANGEVSRASAQQTLIVRARRSPIEGIWLVMEDVSELRRLQRIRAEFIDNLSHELRTPLTTVRLLTETLARDLDRTDLPPRIRDGIVKIDVETGHLVQMVNELLDLSKIEQGSAPLHLAQVDVAELIRSSLERLGLFAERQGVRLEADIEGELPPLRGDEDRLGQLLINLLHNAVKFSEPGGPIIVRARRQDGEVVLSVEDQGVGIPRAELDRVFERFYKVDKARVAGRGGTGLGLAIVRHIAESHGGRVWVQSEEGRGSTFSVAIPASEV